MYRRFFKRFFDIIGALLLLPFLVLEIMILGPFIWFTDRGPVFYNARRAGKGYKPFKMFKLRSMYLNSPDLKNPDGSTFNSDDDPRVTPIGRIMRKVSLDEFPQFLNVLIGNMSFIGPRPKLYCYDKTLESFDGEKRKSYTIKPGVTGYAQAYFRNSITQDEKFHWDAYYADHVSLWMDTKILWQTIISVVAHRNINTVRSNKE
ncbi:sugar transferase [Butyricimonas virosa]|jgi:undecaprenyl phosphate N,N'-diacetylbacillosamine 1-phosphate transferase|uniref:sugar transferase n=1 Tax=Butyricimonas virosa TaxID=544645 RepID=UPI000E442DDD|nr:sugar transferase [Butyricimonas virosa]RGL90211.1 sugar transferase [Butyricimonas virosa]